MKNPSYVGLSLQMALQRKMDVIANNVANMNTTGFKAQRLIFAQYLVAAGSPTPSDRMAMVSDYGTYRDTRAGTVQVTGNNLDVALIGEGYLTVQGPQGNLYTRGGSLAIANDGTLVDQGGHPVLDDSGSPIVIQQDDKEISIAEDGVVSARRGQIGKLALAKFARPNFLQPAGGGLFQSQDPAIADSDTKIRQGALEGSNVQPVVEMTQMIDVQRSYEAIGSLLQQQDQEEKDMITHFSNTSA
jgi:flagellar basal-body rod protein FlgF